MPNERALAASAVADDSAVVRACISEAAQQLAVTLDDLQLDRLVRYLALIQKWNRVYNLTAVREPSQMLTHHIFDSLAVVAPLRRQLGALQAGLSPQLDSIVNACARPSAEVKLLRLLDVGAGAGLPGVVLAICCPELSVTCVDAVAKKTAFIQQVALELKLPNLSSVHARVETLCRKAGVGISNPQEAPYEIVCSRAFASLVDFVSLTRNALAPNGLWMALKGKEPEKEISLLGDELSEVFHVEQLLIPSLAADRCIVWLQRPDRLTGMESSST